MQINRTLVAILCLLLLTVTVIGCGKSEEKSTLGLGKPKGTLAATPSPSPEASGKKRTTSPSPTATPDDRVWINKDGGKRYHKTSSCKGVITPKRVTKKSAVDSGLTECPICYQLDKTPLPKETSPAPTVRRPR